MHNLEVVVLQMRHFEIGRENGSSERNGVAGMQQPIGLQRFEDVAHRRGTPPRPRKDRTFRAAAACRTSPTADIRAQSARYGPAFDPALDNCRR